IASIWRAVVESNRIGSGTMRNTMEELQILKCLHVQIRPLKAPRVLEVQWRVSLVGWLKVNTDGAAFGCPALAGCGGIFRTSRGFFKGAFAMPLGKGYAFEAELAGAIHAISYAWAFGWKHLWLESDSSYLVTLLRARSPSIPWHWKPSWLCYIDRISKMNFHVSYIFREGNPVADILASRATSIQAPTWWYNTLSSHEAFSKDCSGRSTFRFS
ncbi:Ribonuclease H, partial [Parasponia andersonii]